jgi:leader peptidase (prepilin peptidase)/N-methyltransferase
MDIDPITQALIFLAGLCAGSFLNVVIHRVPRGESVVRPGSRCPECTHPLAARDNIPLFGYLLNRGRCRFCDERISIRYPVVELAIGLIFLLHFRLWGLGPTFLIRTVFVLFVTAMAFIDGRFFIIPDRLSLGGLIVGLALSFLPGDLSPQAALAGAALGGGTLFTVAWAGERVLRKEAMGMGDVKMMAMIGSFVGWQGVFVTIFLGSLLGTLVFGPLNLRRRRLIPFGIFLAVGGMIAVYFREPLVRIYISTVWPSAG